MSKTKWGKKSSRERANPKKKIGKYQAPKNQTAEPRLKTRGRRRCGSDPAGRRLKTECPQGEFACLVAAAPAEKAARSTPGHVRNEVHVMYEV